MRVRRVTLRIAVVSLLIGFWGSIAPRAMGLVSCGFSMPTSSATPPYSALNSAATGFNGLYQSCPPPPAC